MSYRGSIFIFDEDGNTVFEQELSQDQIIETLIASHRDDEPDEEEEKFAAIDRANAAGVPYGDRRYKANKQPAQSPESTYTKKYRCSFCKKLGHSVRTCPNKTETVPTNAAAPAAKNKSFVIRKDKPVEKPPKFDNGRLLTEDEFETVKDLRSDDKTSTQILAGLPDDINIQHVNWAILCQSYERYVAHAKKD